MSTVPYVGFLKRIPLLATLSPRELEELAKSLRRRSFARNVVIFDRDSPGLTLYIVESGRVRLFMVGEVGQEISVAIHGPGEVFGELSLLDGLPRHAAAITMEPSTLLTLHRDAFLRHLEANPKMAIAIISILSQRLREAIAYTESLAFLDVYGRVARILLDLCDKHGVPAANGVVINFRLTQQDLASLASASRESVNKALTFFREKGLVGVDEERRLVILNREGLQARISLQLPG